MTRFPRHGVSVAALLVGVALPGSAWATSPYQFSPEPTLTGTEVMWIEAPLGNGAYVDYSTTLNNVAAFVTSGFGGSVGTFTQAAVGTPISATTSGATSPLPVAAGQSILLINKSASYAATCTFGPVDGGTAYFVPASQSQEIGIPTGMTQITCTGVGGTALINVVGGAGIFAGAGGGGGGNGGGGGGGTVTQGTAAAVGSGWPVIDTVGGAAVAAGNPLPMVFGSGATLPAFASTPTVTVGNFPSTQPVSLAAAPSVKLQDGSGNAIGSIGGSLNVNGTFTGSVAGFNPTAIGTPIVATTGGVTGSLPAGTAVMAINVGANPAYCQLGASATGVTNAKQLSPGQQWGIAVGSATQITCASTASTTQINLIGGSGLGVDTAGTGSAASNVVVSNFPATQPVSMASLPAFAATPTVNLGTAAVTNAGTFAAQLTGATNNINNVSGTVSLPTGAATSAAQTTGNASLATIAAGTPALNGDGGAPAHVTNFPATQPVSGTFWQTTQPVNGTVTANAGTGTFTVAQPTAANLNMTCANCSASGGASGVDNGAWTVSSSSFAPIGGVWQSTATSNPVAVSGDWAAAQITHYRALQTALYNSSGTEMATAGSPLQVSLANTAANGTAVAVSLASLPALGTGANTIGAVTQGSGPWTVNWTQLAGSVLGAPSNYGTSPGAVAVAGVNAFVTNTPAVTQSGAWNITNVSGTVSLPTGAATSANQPTNAAIGSTTSGETGHLSLGAVTTVAPSYTTAQTDPLSLTPAGALRVDASATTQPVSAASLPLPSLAATSTKQSDGTQKTQIVDGSGNVIASTSNNLNVADAALLAVAQTPPPINVNGTNTGWTGLSVGGAAQTGVKVAPNMDLSSVAGIATATGIGASNTGTLRVAVSSDSAVSGINFQPTPAYAQLAVGATSARVALPTGVTVVVYNTGANAAYVTLGNASVVATASNDVIQPNSWMSFTVGAAVDLAAIETAGATTLNISGGAGTPNGAGGGSAGGGGTTNLTQVNGNATATGTGASNTGTLRVAISSDSPSVTQFSTVASSSITRAANTTAYTSATGWNNGTPTSFSFTSVCRINGGQVLIPEIDIFSSANPSATVKLSGILWLFDAAIGTLISDDATFTLASGDYANLTGNMQGLPFTLSNGQAPAAANSGVSLTGTNYHAQCVSGTTTINGAVEVTNNYTPASAEVLTVKLHALGAN